MASGQGPLQSLRHSLAFLLSRRIDLGGFLPAGQRDIHSHRDRYAFDVSGLRRGLYFVRIRYRSSPALMGPRLRRAGQWGESDSEVFTFENADGTETFGTALVDEGVDSLHFYPSRLECSVEVERAEIRPITEWARNWRYGVGYVQWRMFGGAWVLRRFGRDFGAWLAGWFRREPGRAYADWWRLYGRSDESELDRQREAVAQFGRQPLVSILLPTWQPDLQLLAQAVDSVRAQTYPNWQLCICDDASNDPALAGYLRQLAEGEPRIRTMARADNGHISAATNSALGLAGGEYIGFLDHDDKLAPDALYRYVAALNRDPGLKLLYSDEDVVAADGRPLNGHIKPDWNYDLLRSINYVCHFLVVDRGLLDAVGGMREGFEGAQDYDLLLRLSEEVGRAAIYHEPRVLYHWRAAAGSTAQAVDNKPYAAAAGLRALQGHIDRRGLDAVAEASEIPTAYRVHYRLPETAPRVSIVIPTRNDLRVLRNCIRSVRELTDYDAYEIVVVDNASDDAASVEYLATLAREPGARVLDYPGPFNFSAINNFAVRGCDSEVVVLLNNDTEVLNAGWLTELVSQASRPEVGAVGAKLLFANDRIQHAGVLLGLGGDGIAGHAFKGRHRDEVGALARTRLVQEYNAVTGACLAVRRDRYLEVGGLDAENLAVAYNDVDFCLRLRERGYVNLWTPYAQLYHFQSYSRGSDASEENVQRYSREAQYMRERWGERLARDEYYSPNYSRGLYTFELAWPPFAN